MIKLQHDAMMKKLFLLFVLLACLSLHPSAWGDLSDNRVEYSVVMDKTTFDAKETFPNFMLIFNNKSKKIVRLLDDFYPDKNVPNIMVNIRTEENGEKKMRGFFGVYASIDYAAGQVPFRYLNPGEKYEVQIKGTDVSGRFRLENGKTYEMEVRYWDNRESPVRVYRATTEFRVEEPATN